MGTPNSTVTLTESGTTEVAAHSPAVMAGELFQAIVQCDSEGRMLNDPSDPLYTVYEIVNINTTKTLLALSVTSEIVDIYEVTALPYLHSATLSYTRLECGFMTGTLAGGSAVTPVLMDSSHAACPAGAAWVKENVAITGLTAGTALGDGFLVLAGVANAPHKKEVLFSAKDFGNPITARNGETFGVWSATSTTAGYAAIRVRFRVRP